MFKDIKEIHREYSDGKYRCNIEIPLKVPECYVFDEDLSVKENYRMVMEHNEKVAKLTKYKQAKNRELFAKMRTEVVKYIIGTYNLSGDQALLVENYVYSDKHYAMCDYFAHIDEIADLVEKILEI